MINYWAIPEVNPCNFLLLTMNNYGSINFFLYLSIIDTFKSGHQVVFILLMLKLANNVICKPCVSHGVFDIGMFIRIPALMLVDHRSWLKLSPSLQLVLCLHLYNKFSSELNIYWFELNLYLYLNILISILLARNFRWLISAG